MQAKFNITPIEFRKKVGVSQQRISQLIQNETLKEGIDYQKTGTKFYMYTNTAINKLKKRR